MRSLWIHPSCKQASYHAVGCFQLCIADQLQRAVEMNDYAEAAHLLEAVQQLSAHFQAFVQIPKVAELNGRVSTLQRALQVRQF